MPEYSASFITSIGVEVIFEAHDDEFADNLVERIGDALSLALAEPDESDLVAADASLDGIVVEVTYDGPNGSESVSGAWPID